MSDVVKRWIVPVGGGRFLLYDDEVDIEEADEVLEVNLPATMAVALDFLQHSYYNMQGYLAAQWNIMQSKLSEDEPEYNEVNIDDIFNSIVKNNNFNDLGEDDAE